MRGWGPADGPVGPLDEALRDCGAAGFSGVLHVIGAPGGTVYLTAGRVTAIETPWSPSPEVILLRSGRVPEADWEAAFTAAAVARGPMRGELIGRGLVGTGELEALLRTALADAMFAFAAGFVDTCRTEASALDYQLPLEPATGAGWLVAEALRRTQVLAAFPGPPMRARERLTVVPGSVRPGTLLGGGRDEVLALADGRRTIRDLAFALGRGLYATMLEVARMRAEGLLASVPHGGLRPVAEDGDWAGADGADGQTAAGLPRRQKDRPAQPSRSGEQAGRSLPAVLRLLRPRADGNPKPRETQ